MQWVIKKIAGNRIAVHAGFILLSGIILLSVQQYYLGNTDTGQRFISIAYFFVCVYTGRWICNTWFLKNRFILFAVFSVAGFFILLYASKLIVNTLLPLNQKNIDEFFFAVTPVFILGMLTGIFAPMIRTMLQRQLLEARQLTEQKQAELGLLQSQLSPHFLFNSLNNLYGLSLTRQQEVPGLLLKLAELLRYSVYETRQSFIPIQDEIQYISNYIAFEKIRIGERLQLKTDIEAVMTSEIRIAPMLLIVFIENAFKHSKNSFDKEIFIDISLQINAGNILFAVRNSYSDSGKNSSTNTDGGGLGLVNVKKRLELLYGGEYTLQEDWAGNVYSVILQLKVR